MEFFETPAFTRHLSAYLTDDEYAALQAFLAARPEAGDVMPGTGGFRKLRWSDDRDDTTETRPEIGRWRNRRSATCSVK